MTSPTQPGRENGAPKSGDYLSIMSLVNSDDRGHVPVEQDNSAALSPVTSPSVGSLSPGSASPRALVVDGASMTSPNVCTSITTSTAPTPQGFVRQNQVSTVLLSGVPIVSLFIDGKERLCLAQISNTLLKNYSYNEIHNRRVALGITCVQCTPVQLEILRRAGAMPISSRRCGMISKREAERLVKSFLEDTSPPKLPENFAFDVYHECGWGCRGNFVPSRYNSSRAKCIKCGFCNMFFSPNKFIFHFHRTPESKYNHPDAANFNSWRRHLRLHSDNISEEVCHLWEDVKAMFNGGSRKRGMPSHVSASSSASSAAQKSGVHPGQPSAKEMKYAGDEKPHSLAHIRPRAAAAYSPYPVFPMPNKLIPFRHPAHGPQTFCVPSPYPPPLTKVIQAAEPRMVKSTVAGWGGAAPTDAMIPPYEMIWAKHLGLSPMENGIVMDPRAKSYEVEPPANRKHGQAPEVQQTAQRRYTPDSPPKEEGPLGSDHPRLSAFRPVGNRTLLTFPEEDYREKHEDQDCTSSAGHDSLQTEDSDEFVDVDVDTVDGEERDPEENNNVTTLTKDVGQDVAESGVQNPGSQTPTFRENSANGDVSYTGQSWRDLAGSEQVHEEQKRMTAASDPGDEQQAPNPGGENLHVLSKEELQRELLTEMLTRKKLEADCKSIKETFQEQVEREKQFREEMSKQLQIVREKLCKELDQERKVRFSLQQKLKEAHQVMASFSSKLMNSNEITEYVSYKASLLPR